ncbi:hypothetical protein RF679_09540 [Undibacterium cyanobacteriorum]|uniref:Uncharacterized protein n=1 Tax=Undibacterium cyanobacteriorum TaxID=3073561 RepID=A0ABY9RE14_9BURK|nr:hypothetical protein [Undibacterium sp. 20NA77.5]WMW78909.1 hypothetical protein RF679_09540 [Undibacterium sp. 20NA77.5]
MEVKNFDKTEKGREEIATRKHQLSTRLRSLLVLVDGKQTDEVLLQKTEALGLGTSSLEKLAQEGYIERLADEKDLSANEMQINADSKNIDETRMTDSTLGQMGDLEESQTIFEPSENDDNWTADLDVIMAQHDDEDRESRVSMMKRYLTDIIKTQLGIRGFFLHRKLQKIETLQALHAFRQDYVAALLHSKGKDIAIKLRDQFDQKMYVRFSLTDPEFLDDHV